MEFSNILRGLSLIFMLTKGAVGSVEGFDLIFEPRDSNAPRALLVNKHNEPIHTLATEEFTMCLFAKLANYEGLTIVDLLSFSSQENDTVNEIVVEIDYEDFQTNLYLHNRRVSFAGVPPLDEWAHICLSWESKSGKTIFYVNGNRVGKIGTISQDYVIGGDGFFVLGQDQDDFNGGFDPDSGVHGKLTQFNLWNHVLTNDEVKQAQKCNLEGNVVNWSNSTWSLLGLAKKEISDNPCHVDLTREIGCGCNNSKIEEFQTLFLEYSTEISAKLNETNQQISNIGEATDTALKNIDSLEERITANENNAVVLRQFTTAYTEEIASLKQGNDFCVGAINGLEQRTMACEREISQEKLRNDDCAKRLDNLQQIQSLEINSLKAEIERNREWMRASNTCPKKFVNIDGGCYYFSTKTENDWNQAMKLCQKMDARSSLVGFETLDEWNSIKNYLEDHKTLTSKNWWIGGNDRQLNAKWSWTRTNRPFSFSAWCPGEPNNVKGNEPCLNVWVRSNQLCWNDLACIVPVKRRLLHFICEV